MDQELDVPLQVLRSAKTIAVLGMKGDDQPDSPAHGVPMYLKAHGYTIIPVNPALAAQGYPGAVATLADLKEAPDVVQVFRRPEAVGEHVDELVALHPGTVWLQLGIRNDEAAKKLEAAGIRVVQDRCMYRDHHALSAAGLL